MAPLDLGRDDVSMTFGATEAEPLAVRQVTSRRPESVRRFSKPPDGQLADSLIGLE